MSDTKWYVEVAEYVSNGYWYDYPPFQFDTEEKAEEFAKSQRGFNNVKVRRVWSQ